MIKKYINLILCLLIVSCTFYQYEERISDKVPQFYTDEEEIVLRTKCDYDKFEQKTTCWSPEFKNTLGSKEQGINFVNNKNYMSFLMSYRIIKKNNYVLPQLYFIYYDKDWAFFNSAYDENGNKLNFVEIIGGHKVYSGGSIEEHFSLNVNDEFIKKYENTGIEIKFKGIYKNIVFKVQPAVLKALKEQLKKIK